MHIAKRITLIIVVLIACVSCDQATKSIASSVLANTDTLSFLGDTVRFQLAHNQGAFLGMGSSLPETWRKALFLVAAGGMLLGLLAYLVFSRAISRLETVALSLVLAGGISNLTDRVVNDGYVVDFLNIGLGAIRTGIFNVADIAISAGALLILMRALLEKNGQSAV
ncbi:MAG: signal peptidase II [Granulosicoccus sp.]